MQLIKAYKTGTVINGLKKYVLISIEVDYDQFDMDYAEGAQDIMSQIEAGRMDCFWVKVTARFSDLAHFEGCDTLGQVLVKNPKDLMDCIKAHDMVKIAKDDLVAQVLQGKTNIDQFLKGA